jgi:hypothetical protein
LDRLLWRRAAGKKGALFFERLVSQTTCTLRRLGQGRAGTLGFGRFLGNPRVTAEEIQAAAGRALGERARGLHVLAIQDTTELNFQRHAGKLRGLGPVGNGTDRGLFLHPVIAVDAHSGALLGLAGLQLWTRPEPGTKPDYRKLPIEDKESYRWLVGAEQAKQTLSQAAHVTVIADRESDIFEQWDRLPEAGCDLLTRASWDRALVGGGRLFAAAEDWPEAGRIKLSLRAQPARKGQRARKARKVTLAVRYGEVCIKRPQRTSDPNAPTSLSLRLVEVREVGAVAEQPIHWRLLTTHRVDSLKDAQCIVDWYRQRWHIEQLFRTLKSQGLDIEASQVCGAEALINLAAMATVAALRILQLVLARDGSVVRPASDVMALELLPLAVALTRQLEGGTQAQKNPHPEASLAWLAWIIARLGGWSGYKSQRPPGPITMRHGWQQFEAMADGWKLRQDV